MLAANACRGLWEEALKLLLQMQREKLEFDQFSLSAALSAAANLASLEEGKQIHCLSTKLGFDSNSFVENATMDIHGGLVDEGLRYFASITFEFGVPAAIEHCVCIVDLLGRSGRFREAIAFIKDMPVPPNDFVGRCLLAACRMHGNSEIGKVAAENLLRSNPSDDSAYVLYSNICATSGSCWVKLKNQISTFGIGDLSHPESEQIYRKLTELRKKIQEAGYIADTSYALHDTDEEQKEHNLWMHSERLALAYALINTPEGSVLRIFKNLRVCGDCHSVFKGVSSIISREIILRDPYRFHHFSGGQCSCVITGDNGIGNL
ncbi:pentatricopeptide repeat-containing protein At3g57430, chloroplastic-like [Lycium ferocissimum]|uniref:pentatricopeptide repeat-containing protein At3g57430, chloroplastic-like n=1 Tax=Lycium ferocissimum TaxID=112874 RepID=UPI002816519F|nr:pentatricopeptide repeat-containing protein At3g57430, chloroplastic-like [Lycium ferocissimum]